MGLLAQLFGWDRPTHVAGEIAYARLERSLRLRPEERRRVAAAYVCTYAEEAFAHVVESKWDAAASTYQAGADQVPEDLLREAPLTDMHAILTYNALVAEIASVGMTAACQARLEERLWPPRGLFAKRVEPMPNSLMTKSAMMLLASYLHWAGRFDEAAGLYAEVASPISALGRTAALRLRWAANHQRLSTGATVPAFFRPVVTESIHGFGVRVSEPVPLIIERAGDETVVHVELPTLERGLQFEARCLELVRAMGIIATATEKTGDGGVDIIGYSNQPLLKGTLLIQCKDWRQPVGEPLYGVTSARQAMKGICITSGTFTSQARRFAEALPIELIDGAALDYWLARYRERGTEEVADVAAAEERPAEAT